MSKRRPPSKTKPSSDIIERTEIAGIHELEIDDIELFTFELDREPGVDMQDDVEHLILFDIKRGSAVKRRNLIFVDIVVGKQKGDDIGGKVIASYFFVAITKNDGEYISDENLRALGRLTIWPLFCNNFKSIISSTSLKYPDLPNEPPAILVGKLSDVINSDAENPEEN